jgi:hypothetical protein
MQGLRLGCRVLTTYLGLAQQQAPGSLMEPMHGCWVVQGMAVGLGKCGAWVFFDVDVSHAQAVESQPHR